MAAVERAFDRDVMSQQFVLRATFPCRELVSIEDPRELEEAKLAEARRALAKGGATSKARSPKASSPSSLSSDNSAAGKTQQKKRKKQLVTDNFGSGGEGSPSRQEDGSAVVVTLTSATSVSGSGSGSGSTGGGAVAAGDDGNDDNDDPTTTRKKKKKKKKLACPATLARESNIISAATVLRHVRDGVDRLAKLADEARPVDVDDVIVLRQPADDNNTSKEDPRALTCVGTGVC